MTSKTSPTRRERRVASEANARRAPLLTGVFWLDLTERAITSAAAGALAVVSATTWVLSDPASWRAVATGAATAGIISLLKSILASRSGTGSASLARDV